MSEPISLSSIDIYPANFIVERQNASSLNINAQLNNLSVDTINSQSKKDFDSHNNNSNSQNNAFIWRDKVNNKISEAQQIINQVKNNVISNNKNNYLQKGAKLLTQASNNIYAVEEQNQSKNIDDIMKEKYGRARKFAYPTVVMWPTIKDVLADLRDVLGDYMVETIKLLDQKNLSNEQANQLADNNKIDNPVNLIIDSSVDNNALISNDQDSGINNSDNINILFDISSQIEQNITSINTFIENNAEQNNIFVINQNDYNSIHSNVDLLNKNDYNTEYDNEL